MNYMHLQVSQDKQLFSSTEYHVLQQTAWKQNFFCSFCLSGYIWLYNTIVAIVSKLLDKECKYYPSNDVMISWSNMFMLNSQWECRWQKLILQCCRVLVHMRILTPLPYTQGGRLMSLTDSVIPPLLASFCLPYGVVNKSRLNPEPGIVIRRYCPQLNKTNTS